MLVGDTDECRDRKDTYAKLSFIITESIHKLLVL